MSNRSIMELEAREAAAAELRSRCIVRLSGTGQVFTEGFVRASMNGAATTPEFAQRMADRKRQLRTTGIEGIRTAGEIAGYERLADLLTREDDMHKFKGSNLKSCAADGCGKSINAQVHKPSWPPNRRSDEDLELRADMMTADKVADKDGIQPADSGDTDVDKHKFQGDDPQKCSKCGLAMTASAHQER